MWLTTAFVIEVATIDVIIPNERYNQPTAFILVFQKTALHMLWHMEFRWSIGTITTAFTAKNFDIEELIFQPILRRLRFGLFKASGHHSH